MGKVYWNLFETIFSDAHVIDIDFSEWDRLIRRIVVESDHSEWINNRLPVYSIEFVDVSSLYVTIFIPGLTSTIQRNTANGISMISIKRTVKIV